MEIEGLPHRVFACRDGTCGISPLLDLLVGSETPLPKKQRVLETLTFLAANSAIAYSICEQGVLLFFFRLWRAPMRGSSWRRLKPYKP